MSWDATHGFATTYVSAVSAMYWACPAPPRCAIWRRHCPRTKSRTLKVRGGIIPQADRYLVGFCSSQRIFPPQIIQVLLKDVDGDRKPRGNRSRSGVNPSTRRSGGGSRCETARKDPW